MTSTSKKSNKSNNTSTMWSAGSTDLFSNKEIALLIELVEALPVLYAADKKLFKGIIPREKAWKIISEKLNRTVTECEKKWRYLRDKYVKERRRLIDESKTTGRETKSNWQHYETMEFLSTHLRLPANGSERSNSVQLDDDGSTKFSADGSPPGATILSPPSLPPFEGSAIKNEMDSRMTNLGNLGNWSASDFDKMRNHEHSESFKPLAPPPHYPGLLNRAAAAAATPAAGFAHHPLWAMWSNSIAQAQAQAQAQVQHHQQHQHNNINNHRQPSTSCPSNPGSPQVSDIAVCNDTDESEPKAKKYRHSGQEVNINVSIKDLVIPAEKFSEYHFCVSLAQMMESVPANQRPELKIKLIQMVTSNYPQKDSPSESSVLSL